MEEILKNISTNNYRREFFWKIFKFLFVLLIAFSCIACGGGSKLDYDIEGKYAMENPKSEIDKEFSKVEISRKGKIYTLKI